MSGNNKLSHKGEQEIKKFVSQPNYFGFCNEWYARLHVETQCEKNQCKFILWECRSYNAPNIVYQNITFYHNYVSSPYVYQAPNKSSEYHLFWDNSVDKVAVCASIANFYLLEHPPIVIRHYSTYPEAIAYCIGAHEGQRNHGSTYNEHYTSEPLNRHFSWSLSELCELVLKRKLLQYSPIHKHPVVRSLPPKLSKWVVEYDCLNPDFKRIEPYSDEKLLFVQ
jgi:hypothetical protein